MPDELVDLYLIVYTDTATRLNIEFTNEKRIAVEKDFKSQINEHGIVQMKEKVGPMKEYFTNVEEKGFQGMLSMIGVDPNEHGHGHGHDHGHGHGHGGH